MIDWNRRAMDLLEQLLHVLSESIETWDVFRSSSGDSGYFDDIKSSPDAHNRVMKSLRNINDHFDTLKSIQRQLLSCKEKRQRFMASVRYAMFSFSSSREDKHDQLTYTAGYPLDAGKH
jgi:hypothetical protein